MRIFTFLVAILLLISCGGKAEKEDVEVETAGENETTQKIVQQQERANKTTGDYVFTPAQLQPINEAKKNPGLQKTLKGLLKAIENKDVEGLKMYVEPNIKIGFGAEYGIDDFMEMWELDLKPEKSLLWQELRNAIVLGGSFDAENRNAYYTPYTFTHFPEAYDAFEYAVITGENVNIRNTPNTKGKVVRQLSHEVVKIVDFDQDFSKQRQTIGSQTHDWQKIQMSDGEMGYVWGKFCRTGVDYRAGFAKVRDEGWKMTFFLAGD